MIKSTEVKTLGEVREILEDIPKEGKEENKRAKELLSYIKKFVKTKPEQRKKLNEALHNLNIIKLNPKFISKIIDLMPEDAEDLRKIFFGEEFTLEQDEINAILETIKQNK